jgi:hypothetical protein
MAAPEGPNAAQARAAIAAALGQIGFCLPGSITICHTRCGKPRCACAADPPALHGLYIQWTRTVAGKTVTRRLTPAQYQAYAPWFANTRRLRALAAELQALSLKEMARAEGWAKITPGAQAPSRTKLARVPNQPKTPKTRGQPRAADPQDADERHFGRELARRLGPGEGGGQDGADGADVGRQFAADHHRPTVHRGRGGGRPDSHATISAAPRPQPSAQSRCRRQMRALLRRTRCIFMRPWRRLSGPARAPKPPD